MNIFATDPCPRISAQNLDDKRVRPKFYDLINRYKEI